ncbi:MAG: 50S ribosomal protein L34 [Ignavibacteriae bacterium]|nr:50S ribosomal protein L34 [Ignavibacteriota bacterium]
MSQTSPTNRRRARHSIRCVRHRSAPGRAVVQGRRGTGLAACSC